MAKRRKPAPVTSNASGRPPIGSATSGTSTDKVPAVVTVQAKAQLARLARHYGVTQRELIERVLAEVKWSVVDGLGREEERAYFNATE